MSEKKIRILLVEDNPGDARLIKAYLDESARFPFEIHHFTRLCDMLRALSSENFDVLLMDLSLPDCQGRETFQRVKNTEKRIPLIVLTGLDDEQLGRSLVQQGAQDYLCKGQLNSVLLSRSILYSIERHRSEEDLIQAREAALRAAAVKSEFLANMSHEIRTPLNAILGIPELLLETPLNEEQRNYVATFKRAGSALLDLINGILDLSKLESAHLELSKTPFDLQHLVDSSVEMMGFAANKKGIALQAHVDAALPKHFLGDLQRLRQILLNLVGNAVKFTQSGEIEICVRGNSRQAGELLFSVRDTGIGIPEDKRETIFENFTQADSSITHRFGGTGLGLAITRRLIELMGGKIWVQSELGKGSTFFFTLRLELATQDEIVETKTEVSKKPVDSPMSAMRILLAEDSADNRMLVLSYLKKTPYQIEIAQNGLEAVEQFKKSTFDLVLMDVRMPEMDGHASTRAIREWEKAQGRTRTPIIALTAHAFAEDIKRSLEAGCDSHLAKPIFKNTLLQAIQTHGKATVPAIVSTEIDPEIRELIPGYLENRANDIPKLRNALSAKDFETIRTLGHNMKGTGKSYGLDRISEIGKSLELAAKNADLDFIDTGIGQLEEYLKHATVVCP